MEAKIECLKLAAYLSGVDKDPNNVVEIAKVLYAFVDARSVKGRANRQSSDNSQEPE